MKPPPPRRQFLYASGASALLPWLGACGDSASPLVVAAHVWPGYELMFLARRESWIPPKVKFLETASATQSMQALREGKCQGAALTLDEVLRLRAEGMALVIVLVFDESSGADVILAKPEIATIKDIEGRRVGIENSAVGALMLTSALENAGVSPEMVELAPLTIDQHEKAWRDGAVDVLVTYEPATGRLLELDAHVLFDSRQLPGMILDVLAFHPEALKSHPQTIKALIAGHFRALTHMKRNPVDASYRMAGRLGVSGPKVGDAFRGLTMPDASANRHFLGGDSPRLLAATHMLSSIMASRKLLSAPPNLDHLTSPDYLPDE